MRSAVNNARQREIRVLAGARESRHVDGFKALKEALAWWEKKGSRHFLNEPDWVKQAIEVANRKL